MQQSTSYDLLKDDADKIPNLQRKIQIMEDKINQQRDIMENMTQEKRYFDEKYQADKAEMAKEIENSENLFGLV